MVNFGFGDIVDRLEKYYGATITKVTLGIFVTALLVFVVGFAVSEAIYPFVQWIGEIAKGNPVVKSAQEGTSLLLGFIWAISVFALVAWFIQLKPHFAAVPQMADEAEALLLRTRDDLEQAKHFVRESAELYLKVRAAAQALGVEVPTVEGQMAEVLKIAADNADAAEQEAVVSPPRTA